MHGGFDWKSPDAPEPWARRGTAEDMLLMARLFECLEPDGRAALLAAAHAAVTRVRAAAGQVEPDAIDPADPLSAAIALLQAYADLDLDSKTQLLTDAIELVANRRISSAALPPGTWEDTHEWLTALAEQTYPHYTDADRALGFLRNVYPHWEEAVFTDGSLGVVAVPSEMEVKVGYGVLAGYDQVREQVSPENDIPDPAEALEFKLPEDEYLEWAGDEEVLNKKAYAAAVEHESALRFAELAVDWRQQFFEALIDGTQPPAPERAAPPVSPVLMSRGWRSDAELEALLNEFFDGDALALADQHTTSDDMPELEPLLRELDALVKASKECSEDQLSSGEGGVDSKQRPKE